MYTYLVKTRAPAGKRAHIQETFVVLAQDEDRAIATVRKASMDNADITWIEKIDQIKRVRICA